MKPAFTKALYYPFIDIPNTAWLKTAMLFWDSISTIVPESAKSPYNGTDTRYLADIGFITPITVNSFSDPVVEVELEFVELFESPEFLNYIISSHRKQIYRTYDNKRDILKQESECWMSRSLIYADKMSHWLRGRLKMFIGEKKQYALASEFVRLYMIKLANKISENNSIALVTDDISSIDLSNAIRYNTINYPRMRSEPIKQGLILDIIINELRISPDTDFESIICFKKKHKDELGRFRTELAKLTLDISLEQPINVLRQEINDLYINQFLPAYNDLKCALDGMRIKWLSDNFLKASLFSASATTIPMVLSGLPLQQALLAGTVCSVLASAITYSVDKTQMLNKNPYSYLLFTKEQFCD